MRRLSAFCGMLCILLVSIFNIGLAHAGQHQAVAEFDLPKNWPWRGVTIGFPGGGVTDVDRFVGELKINFVRLNVNVRQYAKATDLDRDKAWLHAMQWTDSMLDACAKHGIQASVEVNQFPLADFESARMHLPAFWEGKGLDEVVWAADQLARRYKHRGGELAAYQVLSEPLVYRGNKAEVPAQWSGTLNKIVHKIRMHDKSRWIIVSPGPGGGPNGYSDFEAPQDSRLIWGVHMYIPHSFTHQGIKGKPVGRQYPSRIGMKYWDKAALRETLMPLKQFQQLHRAPVFVGEFSVVRWAQGGEQYLIDLASIFDEYGWGWAYFSATGWHGMNPDYSSEYSSDNPKEWKLDYLGGKSERWSALRTIFNVDSRAMH